MNDSDICDWCLGAEVMRVAIVEKCFLLWFSFPAEQVKFLHKLRAYGESVGLHSLGKAGSEAGG